MSAGFESTDESETLSDTPRRLVNVSEVQLFRRILYLGINLGENNTLKDRRANWKINLHAKHD